MQIKTMFTSRTSSTLPPSARLPRMANTTMPANTDVNEFRIPINHASLRLFLLLFELRERERKNERERERENERERIRDGESERIRERQR